MIDALVRKVALRLIVKFGGGGVSYIPSCNCPQPESGLLKSDNWVSDGTKVYNRPLVKGKFFAAYSDGQRLTPSIDFTWSYPTITFTNDKAEGTNLTIDYITNS